MADQPEALRLAECLDEPQYLMYIQAAQAAAELRRLHDIEKAYESACGIIDEQDKKLAELEAINAELLKAMISFTNSAYIKKHHPKRYAAAMAAIAKAEGQK
jgi:hypothetical protein